MLCPTPSGVLHGALTGSPDNSHPALSYKLYVKFNPVLSVDRRLEVVCGHCGRGSSHVDVLHVKMMVAVVVVVMTVVDSCQVFHTSQSSCRVG